MMKHALSPLSILKYLFASSLLLATTTLQAQLYPDLEGDELADRLRADFLPSLTLTYGEARDTLYGLIDSPSDTVYSVYASRGVYLPDNVDPTVHLFAQGINTEHVYPVGRGATDGTPPHRNMFNLRAARVDVNQDRASLPFGEVTDVLADKWYYTTETRTARPADDVGQYAEWDSNLAFEPPHDRKGDIARAMFYIHTMYEAQVEAVDADFMEGQLGTLCSWHIMDPVDAEEAARSSAIAVYQDGKENPYVLDCTLVRRRYCPDLEMCISSTDDLSDGGLLDVQWSGEVLSLRSEEYIAGPVHIAVYTLDGRQMIAQQFDGSDRFLLTLNGSVGDHYIIRWISASRTGAHKLIKLY